MSVSNSPLSYTDCYEVFDRAVADPRGVRMQMPDFDAANHFRMRLHYARKINRAKNAEIYEPGQPLYGTSVYDQLTVRIRTIGDRTYLYLEKNDIVPGEIESLSDEVAQVEFEEVRQLPAPEPELELNAPVVEAQSIRRRI